MKKDFTKLFENSAPVSSSVNVFERKAAMGVGDSTEQDKTPVAPKKDADIHLDDTKEPSNANRGSDSENGEGVVAAKKTKKRDDPEKQARTIFIGNVPKDAVEKPLLSEFKRLFSQYGQVASLRFRSIAFDKPTGSSLRKIKFTEKAFHADRDTVNAYVVFESVDSVAKSLEQNGNLFNGKHLRVDSVSEPRKISHKKAAYLGNLAFDICEEEIWSHFEKCGEVRGVRIVRDSATNLGKGFAYVPLAIKLSGTSLKGRPVRVSKCDKPEKLAAKKEARMTEIRAKKTAKNAERRLHAKGAKKKGAAKKIKTPADRRKPKAK